ncbi:MAG: uroporphyrinogen-III synthase [Burkholderiales bacterium]
MRGKTIALLEARLSTQLADLVRKYGATPFSAPALREEPDIDLQGIERLVQDWQRVPPDLFIFQTGVGTRALFAAADSLGFTDALLGFLTRGRIVVRGPKPTAALRARIVRIDLSATDPYTTAEVLQQLEHIELNGKRVVVQRYGEPNVDLDSALKAKGAEVIEVPTYRWALPENTQPLIDLMEALAQKRIDAVAFTSASQVDNFFAVAEKQNKRDALRDDLNATPVASIGPVCSRALAKHRVTIQLEASPPKLGPLVQAINDFFSSKA